MGEAARRRNASGTISPERQEQAARAGDSVDRVTEADRRWFERRPHRSHRVRLMARSEGVQLAAVQDRDELSASVPGFEYATVVRRAGLIARVRRWMQMPVGTDYDGASEDECRRIYESLCDYFAADLDITVFGGGIEGDDA